MNFKQVTVVIIKRDYLPAFVKFRYYQAVSVTIIIARFYQLLIPTDVRYYFPSAVTISTSIHGMLDHLHRQLYMSILMYHKIHTCHSLHTDPFRWRNSTQVLRNHYVNIPNVSESSHLGQIPTDIIVTDYARCKPCVIIQLIPLGGPILLDLGDRYQSVYCPVLKMLALIILIAYQHVTLVHSWAPLGM